MTKRTEMKKYYVAISSLDRIGNRQEYYDLIKAPTKTAIRNRFKGTGRTARKIYTVEELDSLPEKDKNFYLTHCIEFIPPCVNM